MRENLVRAAAVVGYGARHAHVLVHLGVSVSDYQSTPLVHAALISRFSQARPISDFLREGPSTRTWPTGLNGYESTKCFVLELLALRNRVKWRTSS